MKNSADAYGAEGRTNLLMFDPAKLVLVVDEASPLFDPRVHLPLDERLVRNIKAYGVKTPIVVTKNPETGETEVVAGRQRVRCAREANARLVAEGLEPIQVPATVQKRLGDGSGLTDTMVIENELRTADTVLGRAGKMARLQERGRTEDQLATIFGCTSETVRNTLALLECTQATRDAVDGGKIGMGHALRLSKLKPAEQRAAVAKIAETEGMKPHARAKQQRAIVAEATGKLATPKMRTRAEIIEQRNAMATGDGARINASVVQWLTWVLGEA